MTAAELRQRYPTFYYKRFEYRLVPDGLEVEFEFAIPPDHTFHPTLFFPGVTQQHLENIPPRRLEQYLFHLGLVEMLSYWKATASPEISLEAGTLNQDQLAWLHQLLLKGMGEYFYVNQIDFTAPDFVRITTGDNNPHETAPEVSTIQPPVIPDNLGSILIPIGGGKDSAVTLEILRQYAQQHQLKLGTLLINPTEAATEMAHLSQIQPELQVQRQIDPHLLELNHQGYLNGHTPFSALVAFASVLTAELHNFAGIAVSNERSSNEGNVCFLDTEINHQYSKTYEFERNFQGYCQTYFPGSPHYFSFLRPLFELQIASLFARLTGTPETQAIRTTFRSCNRGQKTNSWCGECSKCLFAYVILSPFIAQSELEHIFGKNLLADESLWPIALDLLGKGENKPLECVGTYEESLLAFYLSIRNIQSPTEPLPALLERVQTEILAHEENLDERARAILQGWNEEHSLPTNLAELLHSRYG